MTPRLEYVTCEEHSKYGYPSKKAAKAAAKALHPGASLHVYPCDVGTGLWHFGHLPVAVVNRGMDRHTVVQAPRRQR